MVELFFPSSLLVSCSGPCVRVSLLRNVHVRTRFLPIRFGGGVEFETRKGADPGLKALTVPLSVDSY